jgi:hypothetical protein
VTVGFKPLLSSGMLRDVRIGTLALSPLLGAAALAAAPASAFVRTLSAAAPDGGGRHYLWWPTREVGYRIQSDCAPSTPAVVAAGEDAATFGRLCREAIGRSFGSWQAAGSDAGQPPCTDMVLREIGETSVREIGYDPNNPDEGNLVLFQPQACAGFVPASDPCWIDDSCDAKFACFSGGPEVFATTTNTFRSIDGMLRDADIEVNGAPPPDGYGLSAEVGRPLTGTADVQDTLTHEIGHLLGLAHNCGVGGAPPCTADLVRGAMYGAATAGEIEKRTLKADDVAGMCHIYPTGVSTQTVNQNDGTPPDPAPGKTGSCASVRGTPATLGLMLALLLAPRRRRR